MASSSIRAAQTMRSFFINGSRAFTARTLTTTSARFVVNTSNVDPNQTAQQQNPKVLTPIENSRFNIEGLDRTNTPRQAQLNSVTTQQDSSDSLGKTIEILEKKEHGTSMDAMGLVPVQLSELPVQEGAVLTLANWNFLQYVVFPYTLAVMYYMDFLLNYLPWWGAIVATTATARLVFFPLVVKQNIIGIKTFNVLPETQKIQIKVNDALATADTYNQALARTKLQLLYKEHGISTKDRLIPLFVQAPMYMSIFFLLRGLTSAPAEGLTTGGAMWFSDLTVPDPYFILPVITCTSMFILLESGMEGSIDPKQSSPIGRYVIRGVPFLLFAFIHNFPAATLLFWSTSNIFTLSFALMMKNSWVKTKLKIPARIKHDPASLPLSNISIRDQFRSAVEKGKVKRTSMDIRRLDDIAFRKAGVGPLRKTYKEPPRGA